MRFIGDVHGKFTQYKRILSRCRRTVQVGDMGLGFDPKVDKGFPEFQEYSKRRGHFFIRGNHDNPEVCRQKRGCLSDWGMFRGAFYVSGAWSVDWSIRVEGRSWWPDEEVSYVELCKAIDKYTELKPRMVFTHDAPTEALELGRVVVKSLVRSRTRAALDRMLEIHRPAVWIFGHHHFTNQYSGKGTTFFALGELHYVDIPLPEEGLEDAEIPAVDSAEVGLCAPISEEKAGIPGEGDEGVDGAGEFHDTGD